MENKIEKGIRKRSKWWKEQLLNLVKRNKEVFYRYLCPIEGRDWEQYREWCREVKRRFRC